MQRPEYNHDSDQRSLRQVRIESRKRAEISQDDGQNWAVSYSDMLMVLMSFFVIFFSTDEKGKENVLNKIAVEIQSTTKLNAKLKSPIEERSKLNGAEFKDRIQESPSLIVNELAEMLARKSIQSTISSNLNSIVIDLPNQLYESRQFAITESIRNQLDPLLEVIKIRAANISITFIGHTDSLQLSNPGKYLSSNTDLSSLRASRALEYAVAFGFDSRTLSSQGAQSNIRNTRSLSIKVEVVGNISQ